ncbi:MAG: hypothetical protein ABI241_00740 [Bacteroidia bacterium]
MKKLLIAAFMLIGIISYSQSYQNGYLECLEKGEVLHRSINVEVSKKNDTYKIYAKIGYGMEMFNLVKQKDGSFKDGKKKYSVSDNLSSGQLSFKEVKTGIEYVIIKLKK